MNDDFSHHDHTVMYISENVPGPSENSLEYNKIVEDFNSQLTNKCNCDHVCEPPICSCLQQSESRNYVVSDSDKNLFCLNETRMKDDVISPVIECNDLCSCDANCGNRVVQKGPLKCLYVGMCTNENKGLGLFCNNVIPKGTFVCEYAGEVITKAQANIRQQHNILNGEMNYIFCLNEHSNDVITQTFVDPSKLGNIGRYANHSCDPNCIIVPVRVNIPIPKLALFATSNISPHTEITFNYGSSNSTDLVPAIVDRTKCLCNTSKCKGWLPYQMF